MVDTETMETIPPYGILSHRWEEEEVTFQEMQSYKTRQDKKGFRKIRRCCQNAQGDGLDYVWVDTCCIDKRSSSELQEAINSMFGWYQKAEKCYAYLFDVNSSRSIKLEATLQAFRESVWFKRGWTLQELLAPTELQFYSQNWRKLGDKQSLKHEIAAATGINIGVLEGKIRLQDVCVGVRMSWASKRVTKRVEDRAYSLLGIFDVRMPMLYGEGKKAFLRLQEEIIKTSDDHSLFAWQGIKTGQPGMLALEPDDFASCHNICDVRPLEGRHPYSVTNRGLSITLSLLPWTIDTYLAILNCCGPLTHAEGARGIGLIGIFLRRLEELDQYARVSVSTEELVTVPWIEYPRHRDVPVNVRQAEFSINEIAALELRVRGIRFDHELLEHDSTGRPLFELKEYFGDQETLRSELGSTVCGMLVTIDISEQNQKIKVIELGFDFWFNPLCFLAEVSLTEWMKRPKNSQSMRKKIWHDTDEHYRSSIYDDTPQDSQEWNEIIPGTNIVLPSHNHSGLWKLKGNRCSGLSVNLRHFERHASEEIRVSMNLQNIDGQINWVFWMEDPLKARGAIARG
ncbi:hypothetical protein MMC11_003724 [Xylographa trunciseda]|nr:hypothetical protein [Xylographa trunciseda]